MSEQAGVGRGTQGHGRRDEDDESRFEIRWEKTRRIELATTGWLGARSGCMVGAMELMSIRMAYTARRSTGWEGFVVTHIFRQGMVSLVARRKV